MHFNHGRETEEKRQNGEINSLELRKIEWIPHLYICRILVFLKSPASVDSNSGVLAGVASHILPSKTEFERGRIAI